MIIKKPDTAFEPEDLIKQSIARYGNQIAVACSFGKDSMTVLHMALKYKPDIKVIFNNTGVEFPETIEYKEKIKKLWNLNLIETTPYKNMTFWKCADKYGLPNTRDNRHKIHSPRCCYYCKERPAIDAYREHKIIAVLTGLTKAESRNRAFLITGMDNGLKEKDGIGYCGQRYFAKSIGVWRIHPIAYWTEEEVFAYLKKNNIPLNPVYTKWEGTYNRCGCLPCTAYFSWEGKLSKSHPTLYKNLKERERRFKWKQKKKNKDLKNMPKRKL